VQSTEYAEVGYLLTQVLHHLAFLVYELESLEPMHEPTHLPDLVDELLRVSQQTRVAVICSHLLDLLISRANAI
jgi:hypothetical protein